MPNDCASHARAGAVALHPMHEFDLLAYAAALLAYGLLSERLSAWLVSAPMFFMLVGLVVGPAVSAICDVSLDDGVVAFVAEVTLALLLFTEAATIDVRSLFAEKAAPARMLVLGLPIAIVLGGVAGYFVLPELGLWPALLLAALLAPTDAALGAAVVESEHVPESTRRAIGVESGLNDGLALPAVLALAGLASMAPAEHEQPILEFLALQLTLGPLAGIVVGRFGGALVGAAAERGRMGGEWQRIAGVGLALSSYALAETIGGNGFVAAFVGGLAFALRSGALAERVHAFGHTAANQMALLLFMVFGATSLPGAAFDGSALLYAALSLTVVRIGAIALSLVGAGIDRPTTLFMGWFGPRGLASILFASVAMEHAEFEGLDRVLAVVHLTVGLSIVLHGVTALPFSKRLGRAIARAA